MTMHQPADIETPKTARSSTRPETPEPVVAADGTSHEKPEAGEIENLRAQIRQQLLIFTNAGRGRRLVEHGRNWREAMAAINRLSLSPATDQATIEALGEEAKTIFMNAWKTNPRLLTEQTIRELKSLAAQNPAVLPLILEELERIGKTDLAAEFT